MTKQIAHSGMIKLFFKWIELNVWIFFQNASCLFLFLFCFSNATRASFFKD